MQNVRKIISEILVSIALILLVSYIVDAGVSMMNKSSGFIPLSAKDRGIIFGGGSIILFLVSYVVGYNIKSRILTSLLIIGGIIMGTAVLLSTLMMPQQSVPKENVSASSPISPQFIGIIIIGYAIAGLGIIRVIKKK